MRHVIQMRELGFGLRYIQQITGYKFGFFCHLRIRCAPADGNDIPIILTCHMIDQIAPYNTQATYN
jgi:hypothetical protein